MTVAEKQQFSRDVNIVLIDDDEIDTEAVKRAFRRARIANPIYGVKDGIEALELLRGDSEHGEIKQPFMILLDLNMPRMSGIEFLKELRSDEKLRQSIVFVLTTSDADKDKVEAYENNIAGYIVKGKAGDDYLDLTDLFTFYWRLIEFPPDEVEY